jgi:hypothetical protein
MLSGLFERLQVAFGINMHIDIAIALSQTLTQSTEVCRIRVRKY